MKVFTYLPGTNETTCSDTSEAISFEALSAFLFKFNSIEEAIQELQREGYPDPDGVKDFPGLKALLEEIWRLEYETIQSLLETSSHQKMLSHNAQKRIHQLTEALLYATDSSGFIKSGKALNRTTVQAIGRFLRENSGDEGFSINLDGIRMVTERLDKLDRMERAMRRARWGYDLNSIDERLLEELLGEEALGKWQAIKNLPSLLIDQGYVESRPTGLRLTPFGLQKVAWNILREIFKPQKTDHFSHRMRSDLNTEPYLIQGTRPYQFGDHLQIDTSRSLLNALKRIGTERPLHLAEEDFEVYQKEPIMRSATVVLLDLSKSMRFEERYIAAKKVALALYALVQKRYPQDRIEVVGFSTKAQKILQAEIPFLTWDNDKPYTNMEEAFSVGQKILSSYKGYRKQIFLITDGEPTAHREHGSLFFQFPPHPRTLLRTLTSLDRLVRKEISLSIFLLAQEKDNIRFMHEMAQRSKGNVFHIHPAELGRCLLMDYLQRKRKWL